MRITAYCLDWHISNSGAFGDLLVNPLKSQADIKLTAWDGKNLPASAQKEEIVIFCMLPPTNKFLSEYKGKVVWLPMWDQAQGYEQAWWNDLPKNMRIISFSKQVTAKALAAGLPTLSLKYYKNPKNFVPATWQSGRIIFYWNRTGLVGPDFLEKLCLNLDARKLIFRGQIDPRIEDKLSYRLPKKFGNTAIESVRVSTAKDYMHKLNEANIFISPRKNEGAGMTFIEAIAKGCCILAYDAPTMNEYISSGRNGLLLRNRQLGFKDKLLNKHPIDSPSGGIFYLNDEQPWQKIANYNFEALGSTARHDAAAGFSDWQESLEKYANFVLEA